MEKNITLNRQSTPVKVSSPSPQTPTKNKQNEFPYKRQPSDNSRRGSSPSKSVPTKNTQSYEKTEETFEETSKFNRQSAPHAPQSPVKSKVNEYPFKRQPSENTSRGSSPLKSLPTKTSYDKTEETIEIEETTKVNRHSVPSAPQSPVKNKVNEFPFKRQPSENTRRGSSPSKSVPTENTQSYLKTEETFEETTKLSHHSTPLAPQSPVKSKVNEFPFKKQPSENSSRGPSPLKTVPTKTSYEKTAETIEVEETTKVNRHSVPSAPQSPIKNKVNEYPPVKRQPSEDTSGPSSSLKSVPTKNTQSYKKTEETFEETTKFNRQSTPLKSSSPAPQSPVKNKPNEYSFKRQPSEDTSTPSSPLKSVPTKNTQSYEKTEETIEIEETTKLNHHSLPAAPQSPMKNKPNDFPFKIQPSENTSRASSPLKTVIDKFESQRKVEKTDTDGMMQTKLQKEDQIFKETVNKERTKVEKNIDLKRKISLKNKNEIDEFIINEKLSDRVEKPDGGLISKAKEPKEPEAPQSPTYRKKGTGPRETFEDRCRKILGMEEDGATLGQYKPKQSTEELLENESVPKYFEVTIEDCDDDEDDEPIRKTTSKVTPVKSSPLKKQTETVTSKKSTTRRNTKERDIEEVSIKDRLRSSTKKAKDDIDAKSSPEVSPDRLNERRRSSNISVHTEIIIDHVGSKSSSPEKEIPVNTKEPQKKSPAKDRRDSGPTSRLTRKDKEQLTTDRRPNKCFSTKTINLSTSKHTESDQIIIDIQHAKSSREPSPDKLVPIPVPDHVDIGSPRYPDVVQEPEDQPKPKPVVTNIPILEEETNEYVGCQITEVSNDRMSEISDEILANPMVEAPQSLEYAAIDKPDDDCLLTVVEKVSKFTKAADEHETTKTSKTFVREFDVTNKVAQDDECLLTVDQKVSKFLKTAEEVTKPLNSGRPKHSVENYNEELQDDDCTLSVSQKVEKFLTTSDTLKATAPQKSPELVARMERQISTQSESNTLNDSEESTDSEEELLTEEEVEHHVVKKQMSDDESSYPMSKGHTTAIELKRQKDILSRPSVFDKKATTTTKRASLTKIENYEKNVEKKNIKNTLNLKIINNENKQKDFPHSPTTPIGTKPHLNEHSSKLETTLETKKTKMINTNLSGRTKEATDIAARRSLFEKSTPQTPVQSGRRPSYMDHTKSSLEHTRRDSLELNKTTYARKISTDEEVQYERRPNTAVKFDVPTRSAKSAAPVEEQINIEEIFDLEFLEELLEKVTSYELRRRIRAQIRVVKKMLLNSETSHISSSTTTYSSQKHHEETDAFSDVGHATFSASGDQGENVHNKQENLTYKPRDRSHSPLGKTISSSLKEVRRDSDSKSSSSQHYKMESHMETSSHYEHEEGRQSRERSVSPQRKQQTKPSVSPKRNSVSSQKNSEQKNESSFTRKTTQKATEQLPIWAERKNILKSPSKDVKTKKISSESRTSSSKTTQSTTERQRKPVEEDCIISSYGIGPTDENGLPLFGIRALKTKKLLPADDAEKSKRERTIKISIL